MTLSVGVIGSFAFLPLPKVLSEEYVAEMRVLLVVGLLMQSAASFSQDLFPPRYDRNGERVTMFDDITASTTPPAPKLPIPAKAQPSLVDRLALRGSAFASFNAGIDHLSAGRNTEAAKALGATVESYAAWPEAHYALGIALGRLRHFDDSKRHFEEALRQRPGYLEASRGLSLATAAIEARQASNLPH